MIEDRPAAALLRLDWEEMRGTRGAKMGVEERT